MATLSWSRSSADGQSADGQSAGRTALDADVRRDWGDVRRDWFAEPCGRDGPFE
ncbi:hypothetical protein RSSM_02194 [Rhodopirellula sallentina SM41]|uniref:Uncharacterized protein n=1 Tax=Rhodopirellula sallentina SM41 TaxID=1263870 RepID=M5U554_9BACT|nr:hypothetical protein RSSM_02194 [Rhodopirellula sallentina SM41]